MIEPEFMVNEFLEEREQLEAIINEVTKKKSFNKEAYLLMELMRHAIKNYAEIDKEKTKKELENKKKALLEKINIIQSQQKEPETKPQWTPQEIKVEKSTWTPQEIKVETKPQWTTRTTEFETSKAPDS